MKILVAADSYVDADTFERGLAPLRHEHGLDVRQVDGERPFVPQSSSERTLRETIGSPDEIAGWLRGHDVLVVHGAPVSEEVIAASPNLRLICCARGGPVNVDIAAAKRRGVQVTTTPGKNAQAVVELTLAFMVGLARRLPAAQHHVLEVGSIGASAFEGAEFFGVELAGRTLGLVGVGRVGTGVASVANALGMHVLGHDPYLEASAFPAHVESAALDQLLAVGDFVSLHARPSAENTNLLDDHAFSRMRPGALFINTARESLVDEDALVRALASGHLGGAGLDVLRPTLNGARHPLLDLPNVIVTPHVGGATAETLARGIEMVRAEIVRFSAGAPLQWGQ